MEQEKYHMATLPNGKPIDMDMLETAMEDSDLANRYFLNLATGEVVFFSGYLGLSAEDEQMLEKVDGSNEYIAGEAASISTIPEVSLQNHASSPGRSLTQKPKKRRTRFSLTL